MLGGRIEPLVRAGALAEGYALLPSQAQPVVMNTKGASAAGKSTMRPLQKRLAAEIGVQWSDFALISPDIWRKYLLDYATLGDAYKYAGTFTGKELAIIDEKLDRYMAHKAERGGMSHLLIDRFRFDSFAPDSDEAGSNLLTRFGHYVYMFFLITPPHATVERSWNRGLDVGRYKAVDDLLAHNIEAYTGMPELFFTWAVRTSKIAWPTSSDRSWTLPVEMTFCCSIVPPPAAFLPVDATGAAAGPGARAASSAAPCWAVPPPLLEALSPPPSVLEQPLSRTRTPAATAASAVRRWEVRRAAAMATRTRPGNGRFPAVSGS